MSLIPLSSLRVSKHFIPAHNLIPNCSIQQKPLLHYHGAFQRPISASKIEANLTSIGAVKPQWRYTMYDQTHFHSTSHEVLCISHGRARLCFGGEENDGRVEPVVEQGDVVIVPAGVGHRLLEDLDGGFEMVGSYPQGCDWDMCYGKKGEETKVSAIKKLEWFRKDPVYGNEGPATEV
ncbi:cupin protein [Fusarium sporotrichioides]|uniref:Cupin protein n=1 Tax=Fusarium sporotrichioides TaxID=5514 RepID=A0A395S111_FUSSP|nr:cupin protein [Fusarium sporotrichioides]